MKKRKTKHRVRWFARNITSASAKMTSDGIKKNHFEEEAWKKSVYFVSFAHCFLGLIAYFLFVVVLQPPPAHSMLYSVSQKTSWALHRSLQQKPNISCVLIGFHQVTLKSNIPRFFFFTLLFTVVTGIWKCGSDPTRCLITTDKLNVGTKNVLPQAVKAQTLYIHPHPTRHKSVV